MQQWIIKVCNSVLMVMLVEYRDVVLKTLVVIQYLMFKLQVVHLILFIVGGLSS